MENIALCRVGVRGQGWRSAVINRLRQPFALLQETDGFRQVAHQANAQRLVQRLRRGAPVDERLAAGE